MMKKMTLITATAISLFTLATPAFSGSGHDHGKGHHQEESKGHHAKNDHHASKAESYESITDALAGIKKAIMDIETGVQGDNLAVVHEMFPKIEASAAYLHDNAVPKSKAVEDRLHSAVDQLMNIVAQIHDASHDVDKGKATRMVKKLNGSLQLVEAYMSTTEKPNKEKAHHSHEHGHGGHHH